MSTVTIITGPPTSKVSKADAEAKLLQHPSFPKGSSYTLDEVEGRWIAAIAPKVAAPPFAEEGGDAAPASESDSPFPSDDGASADKSDGEDKPSDDGPPKEDGPKDDKGEGGEKGLEAQVHHLVEMLTKITDALGLGGPEASPVPGEDAPHEGPPAPPGDHNPAAPGTQLADNKTHTVHERALKPGESPPGTTPIGAPAFASTKVAANHPWADVIGVKRSFVVEEPIGDAKLAAVEAELRGLAQGTGYSLKQLVEGSRDGVRTAKALISK